MVQLSDYYVPEPRGAFAELLRKQTRQARQAEHAQQAQHAAAN